MKNAITTICRGLSKFENYSMPFINNSVSENFLNMKSMIMNNYDHRKWMQIFDYKNSSGNFIKDVDNNIYLDMFNNIASVPLGYNNPLLNEKINIENIQHLITQKYSLGVMPNEEFPNLVNNIINKMSPSGCEFLHMGCGCGSGANENAFKAAFLYKYMKDFGTKGLVLNPMDINEIPDCNRFFLEHHKTTSMMNLSPGSPNYKILSFKNGFHGRTLGCLSATRTKWMHKIGIPAFIWPEIDYPFQKYPIEDNLKFNKKQEEEVIDNFYKILQTDKNIVAFITEPVLSEGGDLHASNDFYREIRNICSHFDVSFMVDEVQTGMGSTGKLWAHSHWNLDNPPDIVSFAKKAQISGFFASEKYIPLYPYMIFNTWMGDSLRGKVLVDILDIISSENILENVVETGEYLYKKLNDLEKRGLIQNLRGKDKGCYIAFEPIKKYPNILLEEDLTTGQVRSLVFELKQNGILVGTCGSNSIRLRPSLIFEKYHADIFIEILEKILLKNLL